ncbi:disulfide oxidoreductase [Novibacillus thermophilus]|uniref:disulfide oxidoreductase n=1 Tax=Novibacillus thermophilus TaxID=1471761 RepID=UPI0015D08610|nr:disulfide oxidoreductase [Novibacillus thermophilus]
MSQNRLITALRERNLFLAWVVASTALVGSLYFSEIAGFVPCELCWYQRVLMYPLFLLLGIANFRRDRSVTYYALPFTIVGGALSLFHYAMQKTGWFSSFSPCAEGVPCSGEYINWLGFITIPFLALVAFILIGWLLWIGRKVEDSFR